MSDHARKGYYPVCQDFPPRGSRLSNDVCVRCLSYVLRYIGQIVTIPEGLELEVMSLQWHHLGQPYPSIGILSNEISDAEPDIMQVSDEIGDKITDFINTIGIDILVQLSQSETLTWEDVLNGEAA